MTTYTQIIEQAADTERSADDIDRASARSQQEVDTLVRNASVRVVEQEAAAAAAVTGLCLHCGEPVEAPRRWCDRYCASAFEAEQKASFRRGY
jgi:RNA polymerase-binding transcription factor DksA